MRIAIFTETFLPKVDGIVTRLTRTLEQLQELGHEALVFAPHDPPAEYAGHRVVRVPAISFRPWYPELFLGLPRPRLGRELDRFQPDVVHVLNPVVLGLWGSTIAVQRDLPLLASFHTDIPNYVQHLNRSEEHTSELQSRGHLVCRLLLEKKKTEKKKRNQTMSTS